MASQRIQDSTSSIGGVVVMQVYSYSPEGEFKEHYEYWPIFRYACVRRLQEWESITYDELPNEFKVQLLLLGVQ